MTTFDEQFATRIQAERYRDRFRAGRRARTDRRERAVLQALLGTIDPIPGALDLPCGTGRLSSALSEASDRLVLADCSRAMLEVAREELSDLPAEYLRTRAENIELEDGSVDLVFSHRFLSHVHDGCLRRRILSELRRVTKRYVLLSFYPPGIRTRMRRFIRLLLGRAAVPDLLVTVPQFVSEVSGCGLNLVRHEALRTFPRAAFFLFERVDWMPAGS